MEYVQKSNSFWNKLTFNKNCSKSKKKWHLFFLINNDYQGLIEKAMPYGLILNELITNALKYASKRMTIHKSQSI